MRRWVDLFEHVLGCKFPGLVVKSGRGEGVTVKQSSRAQGEGAAVEVCFDGALRSRRIVSTALRHARTRWLSASSSHD